MLKVFIDSDTEVSNEEYKYVNFQTISFSKLFSESSFNNFEKLLLKCQNEHEKVLIITSIKNKRIVSLKLEESNLSNVELFCISTAPKTVDLIKKTILKYQKEYIDTIVDRLNKLLEMHETIYYMICYLNN